jgi:hypothetical protein
VFSSIPKDVIKEVAESNPDIECFSKQLGFN